MNKMIKFKLMEIIEHNIHNEMTNKENDLTIWQEDGCPICPF